VVPNEPTVADSTKSMLLGMKTDLGLFGSLFIT
jgi:hypothetical protein